MLSKTVENLKGLIHIEKEHSKADIHYIKKLQESLRDDLISAAGIFYTERDVLEKRIIVAEKADIDDKFLLTKCRELLDESAKLSKRLTKYKESKRIKCLKFRDMYNSYLLISETNRSISLMRNYITQLNRCTTNE